MKERDKRKRSFYIPENMMDEIKNEASRQERSISWIVQHAWVIARGQIMNLPSIEDYYETYSVTKIKSE